MWALLLLLGCGERHVDDTIATACMTYTEGTGPPRVEVTFGTLYDPDCHHTLTTSCTVELAGDTLHVLGEASWQDRPGGYCGSNDAMMAANCEAPSGWEAATRLDWAADFIEVDDPPIVDPDRSMNPPCPCRVALDATTCQTAN